MTPAQKADAIRHRYNEKLMVQNREQLKNQTEEQREKTEQAIQNQINNMSEKEHKDLKDALGVDNLTGSAVRKMLTTAAGTTSFLAFITGPVGWIALIGVEALMINHNKHKLIYELLSQVVWRSVESYEHRFTPREEELPSWLPDIERDAAIDDSTVYMKLLHENEELKKEHAELKNNIFNDKNTISESSSIIESLNQRIKEANERAKEDTKEKQELDQKYLNANLKFQKIKNKMDAMHQEYENLSEEDKSRYELAKSDAEKSKVELEKKEKEIADLYQLIDDSMKESDEKKALIRFVFDTGVIKYVVKNFLYSDLGNIEAVLMEMHQTDDPMALAGNRGKIYDGAAHIEFSTSTGFPCRIFYRVDKNQPNGKTVIITGIKKHNDSRYCK